MVSRDDLRIGDQERDEVTRVLHDAFAQGRITRDELDDRLDAVFAARTAGDLRRVTADLPGAYGSDDAHDLRGPHGSRQAHGLPGAYGSARPIGGPFGPPFGGPGLSGAPYGMPYGAGGWQWPGGRGDLAMRGRHVAESRRAYARRARGGGPRVVPLVLAALVVAALVSGTAWPLFAAVKLLLFGALIMAVAGLVRHRRGHGHRRGGWHHHHRRGIGS
ncbi:DUF1707 domain-containing protein [Planotetraspora sp. A-T 1434]|uniref:DUF1707 SHOCT-like domain-containing protein n=1 Tax=Planotetraspora sp. A-T 1434 TaxID=2979219 RepID=UPI0021BF73BB|nr:DUF1707 domain-containing protein [Planotetraspora sp. A-T 1434]MCT9929498.1 DUF1707 domain-containing protein [Planotetraspora sp. A-T 1434]